MSSSLLALSPRVPFHHDRSRASASKAGQGEHHQVLDDQDDGRDVQLAGPVGGGRGASAFFQRGESANGDRGVAGRRLTVGQVLGSARALGGRGGAGARARADRGLPRRVGQVEAGPREGIPAGLGPAAVAEAAVGGAHREVLKLRDGEGEDDAAEPAESGQQMRR